MSHSFVGVRICGRYHRDLFLSQAFDRWTLISPCWPRGHVFSGLERCSHCRPSIFGSWVHTNTRKKLVFVWRPYDGYIVTSPENMYPVANTRKLRSIGQMPVVFISYKKKFKNKKQSPYCRYNAYEFFSFCVNN